MSYTKISITMIDIKNIVVIAKIHRKWMLSYLLNPHFYLAAIFTAGIGILFLFYKAYIIKNTYLILADRKIIAAAMTGFMKVSRIDMSLESIQEITVEETVWGLVFGWNRLKISSGGRVYVFDYITKESAFRFIEKYYELTLFIPPT